MMITISFTVTTKYSSKQQLVEQNSPRAKKKSQSELESELSERTCISAHLSNSAKISR